MCLEGNKPHQLQYDWHAGGPRTLMNSRRTGIRACTLTMQAGPCWQAIQPMPPALQPTWMNRKPRMQSPCRPPCKIKWQQMYGALRTWMNRKPRMMYLTVPERPFRGPSTTSTASPTFTSLPAALQENEWKDRLGCLRRGWLGVKGRLGCWTDQQI